MYQFNANRLAFTIPLPLGGKSSEELRIPSMVSSPRIFVPKLGLEFAPQEIQIPTFTIPSEYDITLPLMGMMEASAKVNSNYYNWEGTMSVGNNTVDSPSFVAKFNILANSPIKFLSFSTEGNSMSIIFFCLKIMVHEKQSKEYANNELIVLFLKEFQNLKTLKRKP